MRAPGDRNARPRVHEPQLRSLVPADGECPQFAGWQGSQDPGDLPLGTPASLATLATGVHSKRGLAATLGRRCGLLGVGTRMASGAVRGVRRAAPLGGFFLTRALALHLLNADSSGAPASGRATAKNFLPRKFLKRARPARSDAKQPTPAPGPLRPGPVCVTPVRPALPTCRTKAASTPARLRRS